MTKILQQNVDVMDPAQLIRIEAVHRGFLFQHLCAVQCLLSATTLKAQAVFIESDEDLEIQLDSMRIYVQVKYRKISLSWGDIQSTMERFTQLRRLHDTAERQAGAKFVVVSNVAPNQPLHVIYAASDWPSDVTIEWPGSEPTKRVLPTPQASLIEAIQESSRLAEQLPFATLAPETLVWKLAGLVQLAATGESKNLKHGFYVKDLPALFEQLVIQLQELPVPPVPYRVQHDEPSLYTGERIRLIVGYSGAGKTSWLAQVAQHAPSPLVYLDVADTPGAALANTVAREVAGRYYGSGQGLGELLLPGSSGREILQHISRRLNERNEIVTVALDNVHMLPADDLIGLIQAGKEINFVLLSRPEGEIGTFETIIGVKRENLKGWSADTVAAAAHATGCHGSPADCQQLIDLTGGLPLFVLNAISVAGSDYNGSLRFLCKDLLHSTHSKEMVQELILGKVFSRLPDTIANVADLLSLCDIPLTREEASQYILAAGGPNQAAFFQSLRQLLHHGLLVTFADGKIKLHDAVRVVGVGRLAILDEIEQKARKEALRNIMQQSLMESWHPTKLMMFLRLSGEVGRLDVLVEMVTEELFHEMGVWPEVEMYIEQGALDESVPPDQRLKAMDGLAFASMKAGSDRTGSWLDQMDALISEHNLGSEERLRVGMKRMNLFASNGDHLNTSRQISKLKPIVEGLSSGHQRVFSYNIACAQLALGNTGATIRLIKPLIIVYYEIIGLTPELVMGKNAPDLAPMLKEGSEVDDIKHLADSLDLLAKALDDEGKFSPITRLHALKFYDLARAPDSLFRVVQELVEQFLDQCDFDGALDLMENTVLPQLQQWKLADYMVSIRSLYAVVLAYSGRHSDATTEMKHLEPYKSSLKPLAQRKLEDQQNLISKLRQFGPPTKWAPPSDILESIASSLGNNTKPTEMPFSKSSQKIKRNEACPCGSGKRYKRCHG